MYRIAYIREVGAQRPRSAPIVCVRPTANTTVSRNLYVLIPATSVIYMLSLCLRESVFCLKLCALPPADLPSVLCACIHSGYHAAYAGPIASKAAM